MKSRKATQKERLHQDLLEAIENDEKSVIELIGDKDLDQFEDEFLKEINDLYEEFCKIHKIGNGEFEGYKISEHPELKGNVLSEISFIKFRYEEEYPGYTEEVIYRTDRAIDMFEDLCGVIDKNELAQVEELKREKDLINYLKEQCDPEYYPYSYEVLNLL